MCEMSATGVLDAMGISPWIHRLVWELLCPLLFSGPKGLVCGSFEISDCLSRCTRLDFDCRVAEGTECGSHTVSGCGNRQGRRCSSSVGDCHEAISFCLR